MVDEHFVVGGLPYKTGNQRGQYQGIESG